MRLRGLYALSFLVAMLCFCNLTMAQLPISYGTNIDSTLQSPTEVHSFSFIAEAGDVVIIRARDSFSFSVESSINLLSNNQIIASSTGDFGSEARITYLIDTSGTYFINVFDDGFNDAGSYFMTLQNTNCPSNSQFIDVCPQGFNGDTLAVPTALNAYTFEISQGGSFSIICSEDQGTGSGFSPQIELYSGTSTIPIALDSGSTTANISLIIDPGIYTLLVLEDNADYSGTGIYDVFFAFLAGGACVTPDCDALVDSCQGLDLSFVNIALDTCDEQTGVVIVSADTGTAPFTFVLDQSPNNDGIFTGLSAGEYTISVTDIDGCTDSIVATVDSFCLEATDSIIISVGEATGNAGDTVALPVIIENCDSLQFLQGTFEMEFPNEFEIVGTNDPDGLQVFFNEANGRFSYFSQSLFGTSVPDSTVLFEVLVQLSGEPGDTSDAFITGNQLSIEVGCTSVPGLFDQSSTAFNDGFAAIRDSASIFGLVRTFLDEPVKDVKVFIEVDGNTTLMDITPADGTYSSPQILAGSSVRIYAEKDTNILNGLSTAGLFIGQQYVIGENVPEIFDPNQVVAGNANCDNNFTTFDLFAIQTVIIGLVDTFPGCPSWVVLPDSWAPTDWYQNPNLFPYPLDTTLTVVEDTEVNLIGVKIGDILGLADPQNFQDDPEQRSGSSLTFDLAHQKATEGEMIDVYFYSQDFQNIGSFQFAAEFDTDLLEFEEIIALNGSPVSGLMHNPNLVEEGTIIASWFSTSGEGVSANSGQAVFAMRFKARQDIENEALLNLNNSQLRSEVMTGNYELLSINFEQAAATTNQIELSNEGYYLEQNQPNPFTEQSFIEFGLADAQEVNFLIVNNLGEVAFSQNAAFGKGTHRIELKDLNLPAGVYFYSLRAGDFVATRKMIVN